jgi:hypothetical protein
MVDFSPKRNFDFLDGVEHTNTPLLATLMGFRKQVNKHLLIKKFPLIFDDDPKGTVRKAYGGSTSYPYGYWKITALNIDEETQAVQQIKRAGSGFSMSDLENATINKDFLFRTNIAVDCFYMDNDPVRMLAFVERLMIVSATRMLTFKIVLPQGSTWTVTPYPNEKGASIPLSTKEDEGNPGVLEINFGFKLSTKTGLVKPVAKIYNEGSVTTNLHTGGG